MITETSAVNFRQNLGEMINQVHYRHDCVVINKDGKPVAVLVDTQRVERICRMQDRFDALCRRIEEGYAGVPGKILAARRHGSVDALVSACILDELRRVLPRLGHRHGLSEREMDDLWRSGLKCSIPISPVSPTCATPTTSLCWGPCWPPIRQPGLITW